MVDATQSQGVALGCHAPAFQAEEVIDHPLCCYSLRHSAKFPIFREGGYFSQKKSGKIPIDSPLSPIFTQGASP